MIHLHCHTDASNISSPDVPIITEALVKRASTLGHKALAITDHGNNVNKFKFHKLCKEYNIKPIIGVEAYYVKDRDILIDDKLDRTNSHLILLAKNHEGYKEINRLMSDAHVNGFYFKPRVDTKSINKYINPKNVIISSACIGSPIKKYSTDIIEEFTPFINEGNFYLEIQPHNNPLQIEYNKLIRKLSISKNIKTIVTCDVHAIDSKTATMRTNYIETKNIHYEDENDWFVDYPSDEELEMRLASQGIYIESEIEDLMNTTDEISDKIEFYDITGYKLDVPIIKHLRNKTLDERFDVLKNIVYTELDKYSKKNVIDVNFYRKELEEELTEIYNCQMQDYFLLNYYINDLAIKKYGGVLTKTSRGSAVCFISSLFLGFTSIDKFKFPELPLYRERFLTSERILSAKTPPDYLV